MTKDQILTAVRKYDGWLSAYPAERCGPGETILASLVRVRLDDAVPRALGHTRWMCHEVEGFLDSNLEKANRWLGFIQGVLWFSGYATIDQLKDDNR